MRIERNAKWQGQTGSLLTHSETIQPSPTLLMNFRPARAFSQPAKIRNTKFPVDEITG